jgi:hypothetical protein
MPHEHSWKAAYGILSTFGTNIVHVNREFAVNQDRFDEIWKRDYASKN